MGWDYQDDWYAAFFHDKHCTVKTALEHNHILNRTTLSVTYWKKTLTVVKFISQQQIENPKVNTVLHPLIKRQGSDLLKVSTTAAKPKEDFNHTQHTHSWEKTQCSS